MPRFPHPEYRADDPRLTGPMGPEESARADYRADVAFRTRRMALRQLAYGQLMDLVRLGNDPRVGAHLLDIPMDTLRQAASFVVWANRMYTLQPGLGSWHASDEAGRFLGIFTLAVQPGTQEIGIGTQLLPLAWGRGYALEGGEALCTHAFDALGLDGIVGLCDPDNRSVPPLLARLGFVPDGEGEQFGQPALRFALARAQWRGVRPRVRGAAQGAA